jgi:hypothetical protein
MPESQKKIIGATGFNGAQVVRGGTIVPLDEVVSDPRVAADARSVVDFSSGNSVSGDFFQDVRKMPMTPSKIRSLGKGVLTTFRIDKTEDANVEQARDRLMDEVKDNPVWRTYENEEQRLVAITDSLPQQKVPLFGYGRDAGGNLVVVAADGRQPGSAGASISELAQLMVSRGIVDGILGAGGGDVAILEKKNGQNNLLNSPSNLDKNTGERVTRRVPNLLIFN